MSSQTFSISGGVTQYRDETIWHASTNHGDLAIEGTNNNYFIGLSFIGEEAFDPELMEKELEIMTESIELETTNVDDRINNLPTSYPQN